MTVMSWKVCIGLFYKNMSPKLIKYIEVEKFKIIFRNPKKGSKKISMEENLGAE